MEILTIEAAAKGHGPSVGFAFDWDGGVIEKNQRNSAERAYRAREELQSDLASAFNVYLGAQADGKGDLASRTKRIAESVIAINFIEHELMNRVREGGGSAVKDGSPVLVASSSEKIS